jgi:hypothetical protein
MFSFIEHKKSWLKLFFYPGQDLWIYFLRMMLVLLKKLFGYDQVLLFLGSFFWNCVIKILSSLHIVFFILKFFSLHFLNQLIVLLLGNVLKLWFWLKKLLLLYGFFHFCILDIWLVLLNFCRGFWLLHDIWIKLYKINATSLWIKINLN